VMIIHLNIVWSFLYQIVNSRLRVCLLLSSDRNFGGQGSNPSMKPMESVLRRI